MKTYIVRYGIVRKTHRDGRITVALCTDDQNKESDQLQEAYPAMSSLVHILPKIGEMVTLIISDVKGDTNAPLTYLGPVIADPNHFVNEPAQSALSNRKSGKMVSSAENIEDITNWMDAEKNALYGYPEDVALYGRTNSDVLLGTGALALRYGVRRQKNGTDETNITNPTSIVLNNVGVNIIGDKINLIGTSSSNGKNVPFDINPYLADEISYSDFSDGDDAHPVPFGDFLADFLEIMVDAFLKHKHNLDIVTPDNNAAIKKLQEKIVELRQGKMNSNNVFLN